MDKTIPPPGILGRDIPTAIAADTAIYLKALREQDIPYELAEQLARDYHAALLSCLSSTPLRSIIAVQAALRNTKP